MPGLELRVARDLGLAAALLLPVIAAISSSSSSSTIRALRFLPAALDLGGVGSLEISRARWSRGGIVSPSKKTGLLEGNG